MYSSVSSKACRNLMGTISPPPNVQWQVGVCYRPEEEDQTNMLQNIYNSINAKEHSNCLLLGDVYFRKIDWSKGE